MFGGQHFLGSKTFWGQKLVGTKKIWVNKFGGLIFGGCQTQGVSEDPLQDLMFD